jgi:uncharacterized protein YggE
MVRYLLNIFTTGVLTILIAGIGAAQERAEQRRVIQTTGEAIVSAQPDRARIDIGVTTQAQTSQAAADQNARKLSAVLARLRSVLGQNADIRTISYTLTPVYRYPREGGEPTITGYSASNIVRVTLDDLTKVGQVIDAATAAGANQIHQLQFTVRDEQKLQAEALREASIKARQKAEAIAGALNLRISRVVSVAEAGAPVVPVREVALARADAVQTPIEPGTIEVRASVTLTVEIQ